MKGFKNQLSSRVAFNRISQRELKVLITNFTVTHTATNPNATIEYNWIPYQQVYLLKGIQTVEIPAGIFPLSIYNVQPGDIITLYMTATVQILWQPVNALMAEQSIIGYFTIYVVE